VFEVQGSPVLGILHVPSEAARVGLIMVAAGGPQYHVGCCRQLLTWARRFADQGFAVLRFDYRGMGDSGGEFRGFEHVDDDLRAAVDQLKAQQPGLRHVVFWGGCNAASAIMMYAWKDPRVTGFIISNPWLMEEKNQARNLLKHHYAKKLVDLDFWRSLFSGRVNIGPAVKGFLETIVTRLKPSKSKAEAPREDVAVVEWDSPQEPFIDRMLEGVKAFQGKGLILGSGGIVGQEFDEQLRSSRNWRKAATRPNYQRVILERAGHTFADKQSSEAVFHESLNWLTRMFRTFGNDSRIDGV